MLSIAPLARFRFITSHSMEPPEAALLDEFCETGTFVHHNKEPFCEHWPVFFSDFFRSEYDHFVTENFVNRKIVHKLFNLIDRCGLMWQFRRTVFRFSSTVPNFVFVGGKTTPHGGTIQEM